MRLRGREGGVPLKIETLQKWGDLHVEMLYMTMELSIQTAPMIEAPVWSKPHLQTLITKNYFDWKQFGPTKGVKIR